MTAAGGSRGRASRKRPRGPGPTSPAPQAAAASPLPAGARSVPPRPRRRRAPAEAGEGPAAPGPSRASSRRAPPAAPPPPPAVAAQADRSLQEEHLSIQVGLLVLAASGLYLQMRRCRGRRYAEQRLAPLRDVLEELVSTMCATTAPAEPRPELHPAVMAVPGFTDEQLLVAYSYLAGDGGRGAGFLAMSEPHRALRIEQILAERQEL